MLRCVVRSFDLPVNSIKKRRQKKKKKKSIDDSLEGKREEFSVKIPALELVDEVIDGGLDVRHDRRLQEKLGI